MMNYFEADDRCQQCKKLILTEHEIFLFYKSPNDIRSRPGEANAEWQPCPETEAIPMDNGPNRVAYVWEGSHNHYPDHIGEPMVQVFEGPLEPVLWVPCSAAALPGDVWIWICQPIAPKNPITDDWMRSISS
ncbi:hypothetical protein LCGC14_1135820 [marine sediment metagenome]|uniref:Uncharacterized protein n=1 Tax=marine sediment metagenome TaxID=412755 RepID=A0A0F9MMN0_9ZZZZ